MEIYKDLSNPASQEFEKLLNSQLSKIQIEEGKIIEGKINKITDKFCFLFIEGLKSEPVLDVNELKSLGLSSNKLKVLRGNLSTFSSQSLIDNTPFERKENISLLLFLSRKFEISLIVLYIKSFIKYIQIL